MPELYIGFVDTPGIFAALIRKVLKQKYVHVVIGMDSYLNEAYSIGRRNPNIPLFAGFEKEDRKRILRKYPGAEYEVRKIKCTVNQKAKIINHLRKDYEQRKKIHYCIEGLVYVLFQKPYYHQNYFTCSSYLAYILNDAEIIKWEKDFSCVTPKDFYERDEMEIVFQGALEELIQKEQSDKKNQTRNEMCNTGEIVYGQ